MTIEELRKLINTGEKIDVVLFGNDSTIMSVLPQYKMDAISNESTDFQSV